MEKKQRGSGSLWSDLPVGILVVWFISEQRRCSNSYGLGHERSGEGGVNVPRRWRFLFRER